MISYREALRLILAEAKPQPVQVVKRRNARGQVAATDLVAAIDIPPFDNSAMDGFALNSALTQAADFPLTLPVGACLAAGDLPSAASAGSAVEIMTGAPIPGGCDTVVPIEQVETLRDDDGRTTAIRIGRALASGDNLRRAGEDFRAGQLLVAQGTRLHGGHLAALAAAGVDEVPVHLLPEVGAFATGKEVSDDYERPLAAGEIYNSNLPYLESELGAAGIPFAYAGNIGDDPALFADALQALPHARIVLSCGAVSKGRWDFIPELLQEEGARIVFHGVAIKPGKPILFAVLKDGRYYFGLPGNPVATAVGLRFFVQPLIRALLGMPEESFQRIRLVAPYRKKGELRHFLKARLGSELGGEAAEFGLSILDGQESFRISPMLAMNCWAIAEENQNSLAPGDTLGVASRELFPAI